MDTVPATKYCRKCSTEKDVNDFHSNKSRKDGRMRICITCVRAERGIDSEYVPRGRRNEPRVVLSLEERFRKFTCQGPVHPTLGTACLDWTGQLSKDGYGIVYNPNVRKHLFAHRVAYERVHGLLPPKGRGSSGLLVLHKCDRRCCVFEEHLFTGTQITNMQDMVSKGRSANQDGENNPRAKLTEASVTEMLLLIAQGATKKSMADRFGVTQGLVGFIWHGLVWRHVPRPPGAPPLPPYSLAEIAEQKRAAKQAAAAAAAPATPAPATPTPLSVASET